jgi:hypothetical protein
VIFKNPFAFTHFLYSILTDNWKREYRRLPNLTIRSFLSSIFGGPCTLSYDNSEEFNTGNSNLLSVIYITIELLILHNKKYPSNDFLIKYNHLIRRAKHIFFTNYAYFFTKVVEDKSLKSRFNEIDIFYYSTPIRNDNDYETLEDGDSLLEEFFKESTSITLQNDQDKTDYKFLKQAYEQYITFKKTTLDFASDPNQDQTLIIETLIIDMIKHYLKIFSLPKHQNPGFTSSHTNKKLMLIYYNHYQRTGFDGSTWPMTHYNNDLIRLIDQEIYRGKDSKRKGRVCSSLDLQVNSNNKPVRTKNKRLHYQSAHQSITREPKIKKQSITIPPMEQPPVTNLEPFNVDSKEIDQLQIRESQSPSNNPKSRIRIILFSSLFIFCVCFLIRFISKNFSFYYRQIS